MKHLFDACNSVSVSLDQRLSLGYFRIFHLEGLATEEYANGIDAGHLRNEDLPESNIDLGDADED